MTSRAMTPTLWATLCLLGILWGASFIFGRIAVQVVSPLMLVFLRVLIASIALHLYLASRGEFLWSFRRHAGAFLVMGLFNNAVPFALIFTGQQAIGAGLASILNATTPLWTVLIAHLATADEKLNRVKLIALFMGFAGVVILIGPDAASATGAPVWAQLCVVAAAISYGIGLTFGRRFSTIPAKVTATGQLTAAALLTFPALFLIPEWGVREAGLEVWTSILALALFSTALAYILLFHILKKAGATNASLVTLIVPVTGVVLGALVLGETLQPTDFVGMALICTALIVMDGRLLGRFHARRQNKT